MGRLEGRTALITGGNSGIGLAAAKLFVAEGAKVIITGRRRDALEQAVAALGASATGVSSDVSKLEAIDQLFRKLEADAVKLDVLFANAGGGEFAPLGSITAEHFDRTFLTNVRGTLFTVQRALPLLKEGGSIILTGSTSATTGIPAFSVYSASKAAIRTFARAWALELAPRKIRVNVLVPGATATPGWNGLAQSDDERAAMVDLVNKTTPLGRLGSPSEIGAAALFLASDESSFMTGSELFVDGGSAQI